MKKSNTVTVIKGLMYSILALFLVGTIINCGGGNSSAPVQVQAPKALIQDYIAKHATMVDASLVDFYVADEKPVVAAAVEKSIEEKKASGDLERMQQATFDFSNLQIRQLVQHSEANTPIVKELVFSAHKKYRLIVPCINVFKFSRVGVVMCDKEGDEFFSFCCAHYFFI